MTNRRGMRNATKRYQFMFLLRDIPKYEALERYAGRFPDMDISASLTCLSLMRVGSDVLKTVEMNLAQHGLSQGKFILLILLATQTNKTLSPSEIADRADVTRTNITGLLDGLERTGYVERMPNPEDGRALLVSLTPRGDGLLDQILPAFYRRVGRMMEDLSDEERKMLVSLLAKVKPDQTPPDTI